MTSLGVNGLDEKNLITKLDLQLDLGPKPDPRQSRSNCQGGGCTCERRAGICLGSLFVTNLLKGSDGEAPASQPPTIPPSPHRAIVDAAEC